VEPVRVLALVADLLTEHARRTGALDTEVAETVLALAAVVTSSRADDTGGLTAAPPSWPTTEQYAASVL
jgi:hypothetical protein